MGERSMLHLELFQDSSRTPTEGANRLSNKANRPFERRDDLVDPTDKMRKAEIVSMKHLTLKQVNPDSIVSASRIQLVRMIKNAKLTSLVLNR